MDLWFMITAAPKHNGVLAVVIGAVFLLFLLPMLIFSMCASDAPETTAYWSPDGEMGRTAAGT